jgi:type VI secretion system protein ImpA
MAVLDELLQPIDGASPTGSDLRYTAVYESLREARREDDDLNQGAWQRERKVADYQSLARIATDALKTKSKDLQIAAWLTEAWLHRDGFKGLQQGLGVCLGLLEKFWDNLYPQLEDGDAELRAAPLDWIGSKLEQPLRSVPLTRDGYGHFRFKESRTVPSEDQAKDAVQKKAREKLIHEGKLSPEVFDKSFNGTGKAFYLEAEKSLDACLAELAKLAELCDTKFAEDGPSFGKLKGTLEEIRHTVHALLQKKRETDPDPVEELPVAVPEPVMQAAGTDDADTGARPGASAVFRGVSSRVVSLNPISSSETPARQALVTQIADAAAALRAREPYNPAPYLMMRGLRWGDLRAAAASADPNMLEAPPTDVRQHIKKLALNEQWKELLESAENVMAMPCSRAWLDLQRLVVEALSALGSQYDVIAVAIRSELRALIRDVPQLLDATLLDDTPAANETTRVWLLSLLQEPPAAPVNGTGNHSKPRLDQQAPFRWQNRHVDVDSLAREALRAGEATRAFELMFAEINNQTSSRGRFQRKLQLVEICIEAGKEAIAQPILEDLVALIDAHKLEEWEDRSSIAGALVTIMKASKKIQGDAKEKQKYFERVCRLDPVQALSC